jgi:hypothetical protein
MSDELQHELCKKRLWRLNNLCQITDKSGRRVTFTMNSELRSYGDGPARCPVRAVLDRVLLGPCPWLHLLRSCARHLWSISCVRRLNALAAVRAAEPKVLQRFPVILDHSVIQYDREAP